MSSLPPATVDAAQTIFGSSRAAAPLLPRLRQGLARSLARLTWQRLAWGCAFCVAYGLLLAPNRSNGGAPQSLLDWFAGFSAALSFFIPPLVAVSLVADFAPRRIVPRAIVLGFVVAAGLALGHRLYAVQDVVPVVRTQTHQHVSSLLPLILMAWIGLIVHLLREREESAEQALHEGIERKLELERQISEAELQVLQSQIEPHFLFNSLAHVRRMYRTDRVAGREMLRYLSSYLGAAQPLMRERCITLGQDLELAVAYLNIQRIRMGSRLAFEIDVPSAARSASVPPMMLTTLIENAIKHGLSPLPEGGLVRITAHHEGDFARILVSDTGRGFQASLGSGVGLANVRARLAILHSDAASLSLSQGMPRGITATVVVPTRCPSVSR